MRDQTVAATVAIHETSRAFGENFYLAQMRFRCEMALETVGIVALLFAHLTKELELLQALGFDALPQVF